MVLDGAIDPALPTVAYATDQADSLESELQSFLAWCASGRGAARGTRSAIPPPPCSALIQSSQTRPLPVAGGAGGRTGRALRRPAGRARVPFVVADPGRGAGRSGSRETVRRRRPWPTAYESGGSTNGADAEEAIDCLDHPVDRNPSSYPALADRLARSAPVFGPFLAWGLLGCATWAGPPDPDPGAGIGPRGTAHPGGGDDRRPGHPVPVGGGPGRAS